MNPKNMFVERIIEFAASMPMPVTKERPTSALPGPVPAFSPNPLEPVKEAGDQGIINPQDGPTAAQALAKIMRKKNRTLQRAAI